MERFQVEFFDTHVHLDFWNPNDLGPVLHAARAAGVHRFLVPGVDRKGWSGLIACSEIDKNILLAPGLHPRAAGEWDEDAAAELERLCDFPRVVAIGEIGLDGMLDEPEMPIQERAFRAQLRLAIKKRMPVLIHCRKSAGRVLGILRQEGAERVGGIFHAYSGSRETAMSAISLGFGIGFGGALTFPNARRGPEVLDRIPEDWILLETDAPDLAPHPHRGQENKPAWLSLIAARAAEIRGWSAEKTARTTSENAWRILKL